MGEEKGGREGESLTWAHLVLFAIIIAVGNVVGGRKGGGDLYINPLFIYFSPAGYLWRVRRRTRRGEGVHEGGGRKKEVTLVL